MNEEIKTRAEKSKSGDKMRYFLLLWSLFPNCLAFSAISILTFYAMKLIISQEIKSFQIAVEETSMVSIKAMCYTLSASFMSIYQGELESILSIRDSLLDPNQIGAVNPTSGRYSRPFRKFIEGGQAKYLCKNLQSIIKVDEQRNKLTPCLLAPGIYDTFKELWKANPDDFTVKNIKSYPILSIGEEVGRGKVFFTDLSDSTQKAKLKEIHPDLPFDVQIAQSLASRFASDSYNDVIGTHISFNQSSLFYINSLDITPMIPREISPPERNSIPCNSSETFVKYKDEQTVGFDARCRPWSLNIRDSLADFLTNFPEAGYGEFERAYPLIISPLYTSSLLKVKEDITVCTVITRITQDIPVPHIYTSICSDLKLSHVKEMLYQQVLSYYISVYSKERASISSKFSFIKNQDFEGTKGKDLLRETIELSNDLIGFFILRKNSFKGRESGFNDLIITSWDEEVDELKKRDLNQLTANQKVYLESAKRLDAMTRNFIELWDKSIIKNCIKKNNTIRSPDCEMSVNNFENEYQSILKDQGKTDPSTITAVDVNFLYNGTRNNQYESTLFRIGIIFPLEGIQKASSEATIAINLKLYLLLIVRVIVLIIILATGGMAFNSMSRSISKSLSDLIEKLNSIRNQTLTDILEDAFLDECYEAREMYNCLTEVLISFTESNANQGRDETQQLLKLTTALELDKRINNYRRAGSISNNIGNILFKMRKLNEAIESYTNSINFGEMLPNSNTSQEMRNVIYRRKSNLAIALKEMILEDRRIFVIHKDSYRTSNISNQYLKKCKKLAELLKDIYEHYLEIDEIHRGMTFLCDLIWALIELKNVDGAKIFYQKAEKIISEYKKKYKKAAIKEKWFDMFVLRLIFLSQELDICTAEISMSRGNHADALEILTVSLTKGERYNHNLRRRALQTISYIFEKQSLKKTPYLKKLMNSIKPQVDLHNNYILLLDYSRSMRGGNKIENAVGFLLKIWDKHIRPTDSVAFIRYNLNSELVFGLEDKQINEPTKRHEIERSLIPFERTAFMDSLKRALYEAQRAKDGERTFIILICDGLDSSSKTTKEEILKMIHKMKDIIIIGIGLGLGPIENDLLEEIVKASSEGMKLQPVISAIDSCLEMISRYTLRIKLDNLYYEHY